MFLDSAFHSFHFSEIILKRLKIFTKNILLSENKSSRQQPPTPNFECLAAKQYHVCTQFFYLSKYMCKKRFPGSTKTLSPTYLVNCNVIIQIFTILFSHCPQIAKASLGGQCINMIWIIYDYKEIIYYFENILRNKGRTKPSCLDRKRISQKSLPLF